MAVRFKEPLCKKKEKDLTKRKKQLKQRKNEDR